MKMKHMVPGALMIGLLSGVAHANDLYFQMNNQITAGPRQAFIFGAANSTGTVTGTGGFNQAFNLGAAGFAVVDVPISQELTPGAVQDRGFKITSTASLSGYYLSRASATSDMSYLIDGSKLGRDYVVAGYQNIRNDQMSVQATADNTVVTFRPTGAPAFDVTLNAGQTYLYEAPRNLTGSRITSDKAVAVFSGNHCANVPSSTTACDHLVEQMPSVDVLSKSYIVAQTARTGTYGNVMRIVATADDTEVRVNGTLVATLDNGQFYEGQVQGGLRIDASEKVLVAEYLIGSTLAAQVTDPAMTIVPGSDQWLKSYVFATPSGSADFPSDFINIVIDSDDIDSLFIDGVLANAGSFSAIGATGFSFANFDVSTTVGPFSILADNPFGLLLSGAGAFDSYFTYGGAAFSPGASPPPPPDNVVPEPATWALMIAGFGLVGTALRRRRTIATA